MMNECKVLRGNDADLEEMLVMVGYTAIPTIGPKRFLHEPYTYFQPTTNFAFREDPTNTTIDPLYSEKENLLYVNSGSILYYDVIIGRLLPVARIKRLYEDAFLFQPDPNGELHTIFKDRTWIMRDGIINGYGVHPQKDLKTIATLTIERKKTQKQDEFNYDILTRLSTALQKQCIAYDFYVHTTPDVVVFDITCYGKK
jgi:hypothetical protein